MDSEDTMQGDTGMDKPGTGEAKDGDESVSVFLPKAITMGKTFKPGEEIVLKVKDVDSESGELECVYAPEHDQEDSDSMDSAFDRAMPKDNY